MTGTKVNRTNVPTSDVGKPHRVAFLLPLLELFWRDVFVDLIGWLVGRSVGRLVDNRSVSKHKHKHDSKGGRKPPLQHTRTRTRTYTHTQTHTQDSHHVRRSTPPPHPATPHCGASVHPHPHRDQTFRGCRHAVVLVVHTAWRGTARHGTAWHATNLQMPLGCCLLYTSDAADE